MKAFFSAKVYYMERGTGDWTESHISGIEIFNSEENLADQVRAFFHEYEPDCSVISTVNVLAFSPVELDSSNHTEKLIELWRIERTAGEYYGGKNTGAYINKELAKLGITL